MKHSSIRPLVHLMAGLLFMGLVPHVLAQDAPATPATPAPAADTSTTPSAPPAAPTVTSKTLFEQIEEGGWVMIPIGACSVATIYLIVDGILRTALGKVAPLSHEGRLKELFRNGDYVGAYKFCKTNVSPLTNVVRVGVSLLGEGKVAVEEGMLGELAKENSKLQTWISYLSVIGVCSPMIGLLGTVTGMIRAFATLGASGIGDPSSLSSAIGEVLVATASGLFIAIPAFMAFYFLRNRSTASLHHIQDIISALFRKMPYEYMEGVQIGDELLFAAIPNWVQAQPVHS